MATLVVTPGTRIGKAADFQAGPGTYVRDDHIYAATLGRLKQLLPSTESDTTIKDKDEDAEQADSDSDGDDTMATDQQPKLPADPRPVLFVARRKEQDTVPSVGNLVVGKVLRINARFATVAIMMVEARPCKEDYQGVIRVQDVRATEKDSVRMANSFRPGDIIRARILSLGDLRSYYLSTAQNELGVILAQSVAGAPLVPVSWEEMQCSKTKVVEYRKCAKPY
ncbi:hypothetical protein IWQ60_002695 [Tieghemiomyces parasiticus]|uniref:S1 motif domain-containing protein n=1 Tax=Tieghemiomyces parasiticus TaxID=78921 RepID=A0A9W8E0V7_9FUNG|nr:hypothetical protein IWQ60_002695 [Tieghemiomyces parasiticus]